MKAAIYARTSKDTDDIDGSKSIPEQVADCEKLCAQFGYTVADIFREPNHSGRTYPEGTSLAAQDLAVSHYFNGKPYTRPQLGKLLENLKSYDVIVIRDKTRLARSLPDSYLLNFLFQTFKGRIKIHSVLEGLQTDSEDNFLLDTLTSISQSRAIQKQTANSKAKLHVNKDSGKLASGCKIIGYRYAGNQKVEIEETEAKLIRRIYKMRIKDGFSTSYIVRTLNDEKAGSKKHWRNGDIVSILYKRPQYFGYSFNSKGQLIKSAVIPPILSYSIDLFRKMHADYLRKKEIRHREPKPPHEVHTKHGVKKSLGGTSHVMSGLIYCGKCGNRMNLYIANTGWFYCCPNHKLKTQRDPACKGASVKEKLLLSFFRWLAVQIPDTTKVKTEDLQAKVEKLTAQREKLKKSQDALYDRISEMEKETFARQSKRIEGQLNDIETQIAKINLIPQQTTTNYVDKVDYMRERIKRITMHPDYMVAELTDKVIRVKRINFRGGKLFEQNSVRDFV